eukprot:1023509-Pyramimonas_sp.AAC.1
MSGHRFSSAKIEYSSRSLHSEVMAIGRSTTSYARFELRRAHGMLSSAKKKFMIQTKFFTAS